MRVVFSLVVIVLLAVVANALPHSMIKNKIKVSPHRAPSNASALLEAHSKGDSCTRFNDDSCANCVTSKGKSFWRGKYACQWDSESETCHSVNGGTAAKGGTWITQDANCPRDPVAPFDACTAIWDIVNTDAFHEHFKNSVATDAQVFQGVAPPSKRAAILKRESDWRMTPEAANDPSLAAASVNVAARTRGPRADLSADWVAAGQAIWNADVGTCGAFAAAAFSQIFDAAKYAAQELPRIEFATLSNHGFLIVCRQGPELASGEPFPEFEEMGDEVFVVDGWLGAMGLASVYDGTQSDAAWHSNAKLEWELKPSGPEADQVSTREAVTVESQADFDAADENQAYSKFFVDNGGTLTSSLVAFGYTAEEAARVVAAHGEPATPLDFAKNMLGGKYEV